MKDVSQLSQRPQLQPHTASKMTPCSRKLLAVSIAMIAATQVYAQQPSAPSKGAFEEITVTAQRRTELAVDVPIAITAIDSEQINDSNAQQLADLAKLTPSLRFDRAGSQSQPTIRGVGTSVAVAGGSSNVGIYTDGFYSPNPLAADFDLLNISSIQVLKGPQGTLFGRNSTGGAILVTTKEPSLTPSVDISASYGSYDTQRYQVYATGGLFDKLAVDIAGQLRKSDGFVDNILTGTDDDAAYENSSVRIGAKLDITDRVSALLRYSYADNEDNTFVAANAYEENGQAFSTAAAAFGASVATKPHKVSNGFKPEFTGRSSATQLTIKADFDFALLTSYTQYRDERGRSKMDFDMSDVALFHYKYDNVDTVFTQEFLFASSGEGPLQWTTGLFYFDNTAVYENNQSASFGPFIRDGGSGVDVNTIAIYGDLTYELLSNLYLTAGLRYSEDSIENGYFLNPTLERTDVPKIDDDELTPRLVLRFKPNDNSSMYLSYTEGYKSGILNVGGGTLVGIEVEPEKIKAYETGYKYSSGPAMFDVSAFYYDYKNLQVASYENAASIIKNAATSNVYGLDGQIRYAFADDWEANLGIAYVHTEYENFAESQVWYQIGGFYSPEYIDASGNEMQRAPELTGTLGLTYRTDLAAGKLAISGIVYHSSDFYFDSTNQYKQDAYDLLSMRAQWTDPSGHYTLAVFGDNLTDEEYRNQVLPQFFGALSTWGAPRTFGVSVGVHF